jgi:hypothetical protein
MSHTLNRYEVVYRVYVDAHDSDDAIDQVYELEEPDLSYPDNVILLDEEGDKCEDEDCEYNDEEEKVE